MLPCDYCGKPDQAPDSHKDATIMCDECWEQDQGRFLAEILEHRKEKPTNG